MSPCPHPHGGPPPSTFLRLHTAEPSGRRSVLTFLDLLTAWDGFHHTCFLDTLPSLGDHFTFLFISHLRSCFLNVCLFLPVVFQNLLLTFLPLTFPSPHIALNTVLMVIPLKLHPYTPKNWKRGPSQVHGYTFVNSIIPSSQKVETAQVSIIWWWSNKNVVYISIKPWINIKE